MFSYDIEIIDENNDKGTKLELNEVLSNITVKVKLNFDGKEFIFYSDLYFIEYRYGETLAVFNPSYLSLKESTFSRFDALIRTMPFEKWKEFNNHNLKDRVKFKFLEHIKENYNRFSIVHYCIEFM